MSALREIVIDRRYCGPPGSGNGGYVCGLLAGAAGLPLEVRLRIPPPLGRPLQVAERDGEWQVLDGERLVATGRSHAVELVIPEPPSFSEAQHAARDYAGFRQHPYPGCFVCGPERGPGDGLRVFAAPVAGYDLHAAAWQPDESLAGEDGRLRPEFMWAALDCPGAFASAAIERAALLAQFAARIERCVRPGEACVVTAWSAGHEGRKHYAGTAVFDADGVLCGSALATWIAPRA